MQMEVIVSYAAARDIHNIFIYTAKKWGKPQAKKYTTTLKNIISKLAVTHTSPLLVSNYSPNTHYVRAGKHHIYFKVSPPNIYVLRVLHQQQHPPKHIK